MLPSSVLWIIIFPREPDASSPPLNDKHYISEECPENVFKTVYFYKSHYLIEASKDALKSCCEFAEKTAALTAEVCEDRVYSS